jgi:hypothetical protein
VRYTNSALDARPYPLNSTESPRLPSHNEQIGVSFGGPLVIPKIYNGSNKTTFFVNWNLQRGINPFDSYATVPTAAERLGDFSQAAIATGPLAGTVPIIYNPVREQSDSLRHDQFRSRRTTTVRSAAQPARAIPELSPTGSAADRQ